MQMWVSGAINVACHWVTCAIRSPSHVISARETTRRCRTSAFLRHKFCALVRPEIHCIVVVRLRISMAVGGNEQCLAQVCPCYSAGRRYNFRATSASPAATTGAREQAGIMVHGRLSGGPEEHSQVCTLQRLKTRLDPCDCRLSAHFLSSIAS